MATHYFYLDESGDLDLDSSRASTFFGIGTAYQFGDHGSSNWAGHELRIQLEERGIHLPRGLHAKNDNYETRNAMFGSIAQASWTFESTHLLKKGFPANLELATKSDLYHHAVQLHFAEMNKSHVSEDDFVVVIASQIGVTSHRRALRNAIQSAFKSQASRGQVVVCLWESSSTFGLQVADYFLWRVQRELEGRNVPSVARKIDSQIKQIRRPWNR